MNEHSILDLPEEWEDQVNNPEHQEQGNQREFEIENLKKDRNELFADFHSRSAERRLHRLQIDACRYAFIAFCCMALAFISGNYGIDWLTWLFGIIAGILALISSYGFGCVHVMSKYY